MFQSSQQIQDNSQEKEEILNPQPKILTQEMLQEILTQPISQQIKEEPIEMDESTLKEQQTQFVAIFQQQDTEMPQSLQPVTFETQKTEPIPRIS